MTDDRLFARRLHALADLLVAVPHGVALRSGCGAGNQTTNGTAQKDICTVLSRTPLRLGRGDRGWAGRLEGGGKQVAGRQAAVGPPFLGDVEDLLLAGEVVEPVGGLDGLTEREVARQDDIFSLERDEEGALHGPTGLSRGSR
jgi:hypothetical protein